jgi:hypothetical protein
LKSIIIYAFCCSFIFNASAQNTFVVNAQAVNLHSKPSANSAVIGKAKYGDTLFFKDAKGNWLNVSLKDGQEGFIMKKFTTPVVEIIPVKNISNREEIDMSGWNFSFLFSATFKYFLLITVIILLALLLIHYFK